MRLPLNYLHFMLELYNRNSYLTGTITVNTRRISRKIVKENLVIKAIYRGGGQFFIQDFIVYNNPNHIIGED